MITFSFPAFENVSRSLAGHLGLSQGAFERGRFACGELHVELKSEVAGRTCLVVGTIAPPEENLLAFLMLCDTLHREGAKEVYAVLPYLAYSRQDRCEGGRSRALALIGDLLASAHVQRVLTIDVHSPAAVELFPLPLLSLSPAGLFAGALMPYEPHDVTVVAPDAGAAMRCEALRAMLEIDAPVAVFEKKRSAEGVVSRFGGKVGERAIICDDILDSGSTLIKASELLLQRGVKEILITVTHGVFSGSEWRRLFSLGVRKIFVTDSIPGIDASNDERIEILPCTALLAEEFEFCQEGARLRPGRWQYPQELAHCLKG